MPWIIDYPAVVDRMRQSHMRCLYHNSGAFGFLDTAATQHRGWIGPDDPTLRPAARELARGVIEPHEATLATLAERVWLQVALGKVWVMPMSHWAYELDFGSREWLADTLEHIDIDPGLLEGRNTAPAIEFASEEAGLFHHLLQRLLERLAGSDFALAFPHHALRCTVHHHKQLWWTTTDPALLAGLDAVAQASNLLRP